jgi:hypothetical protein
MIYFWHLIARAQSVASVEQILMAPIAQPLHSLVIAEPQLHCKAHIADHHIAML